MMKIGDFSKMGRTTVKTLRYYDAIGLLRPKQVDQETGYRLYTTDQLMQLDQIRQWRQMGLTVDDILRIRQGAAEAEVLEERRTELRCDLKQIQGQLLRLDSALSCGTKEKKMLKIHAVVKHIPECIVMAQKLTIPDYSKLLHDIPTMGQKVGEKYPDLKCSTPDYCFVKELDGEYREKDIHVEICQAVEELRPDFDDIVFRKEPAVEAVCALMKGSYDQFGQVYAALIQWCEDNHAEIIDDPRESYIDGIWNKEREEDWLTEVQIPIRR